MLTCRMLITDEDRRHQRDVRQVVAAEVGVIEDDDITGPEGCAALDGRAHRGGHRSQMDGDMGRLSQHRRLLAAEEHGATIVEPLLDIGAIGRAAERDAHLLGDRSEQVIEDG